MGGGQLRGSLLLFQYFSGFNTFLVSKLAGSVLCNLSSTTFDQPCSKEIVPKSSFVLIGLEL